MFKLILKNLISEDNIILIIMLCIKKGWENTQSNALNNNNKKKLWKTKKTTGFLTFL